MLKNSKEKGFQAKQEGVSCDGKYAFPKPSTSSRQWSAFRNPRIVRVSRTFGGKDRHSKVCTIRGLRDRRIRLSVPTAIQLYDLQDKLRLGQPSKVIDWLLDVTKLDIDKLPPLQIPPGFSQFHQQMLFPQDSGNSSQFSLPPFFDVKDSTQFKDVDQNQTVLMGKSVYNSDKGKWINNPSDSDQIEQYHEQQQQPAQKLFPIANSSSLPNAMNSAAVYNYYNSDQNYSCLSLSQFGNNNGVFPSQMEAQTSSSSAARFTPFPPFISNPFESHIQFLSSNTISHPLPNSFINPAFQPFSSPNLRPFSANFSLKHFLHPDNNGGSGKDGAGSSS